MEKAELTFPSSRDRRTRTVRVASQPQRVKRSPARIRAAASSLRLPHPSHCAMLSARNTLPALYSFLYFKELLII